MQECLPDNAAQVDPDSIALREFMGRFVGCLPREKRVIFLRRYYFGDTLPEIASRLGCSRARINAILYRIRADLKTQLEQEGFL